MSPYTRALTGVSVGISISESEDSGRLGFGSKEVNQVTVDFSRELVGQGASVVFGHDWRPDGVMHAVATAAAGAQPLGEPTEPITSPPPGTPQTFGFGSTWCCALGDRGCSVRYVPPLPVPLRLRSIPARARLAARCSRK